MSTAKSNPPITHIPTKHCSVCGIPALGGCDYCLTHMREEEYRIGETSLDHSDSELDWLVESMCGEVD